MNKFYSTIEEIQEWLNTYASYSFGTSLTFIKDKKYGFVVNVNGSISIKDEELIFIPIKFNIIEGNFTCTRNKLTNLEFAPIEVQNRFDVSNNALTSLLGAPKIVHSFNCSYNKLTSLEGGPEVIDSYYCTFNLLLSLNGAPKVIEGDFDCSNNQLTSLEGGPKKIGRAFELANNKINTLEFIPDFVGEEIFLNDNPALSIAQEFDTYLTYEELASYSKIFKEKKLLNNTLHSNAIISSTNKI